MPTNPTTGSTSTTPVATVTPTPIQKSLTQPSTSSLALLRADLLELVSHTPDEKLFRASVRQLTLQHTAAIGCCHVIRDADGDWDVGPKHSSGRTPRRHDFLTTLATRCDQAISRRAIQVDSLAEIESLQAILVPVFKPSSLPEVFVMVYDQAADIGGEIIPAEAIGSALTLWLQNTDVAQSNWKLTSLASLIELVSEIESCGSQRVACQRTVDQLARHLGVHSVAIGVRRRGKLRLQALSGAAEAKSSSQSVRMYLQALHESVMRDKQAIWPTQGEENSHLLLAHRQLAQWLQVESVASIPLKSIDEKVVGACLLTGPKETLAQPRAERFLAASAVRIGTAIDVVGRAEQSHLRRFGSAIAKQFGQLKSWAIAALVALFIALACLPIPYRVRCNGVVEPIQRRYATAPFSGLIEQGRVRPGDKVTAGQVIASMDSRQVRLELAEVRAQREQARKKREVELSQRHVARAMLADLEGQRLAAREKLLLQRRSNLEIRSPIDGIILSGSADRFDDSAVETGHVIFEIGPLNNWKLQLAIPAEEIPHVKLGTAVTVWMQGLEGQSIIGSIDRISPQAEIRDGQNVFIAECNFDRAQLSLRPGMKGHARIEGPKKPVYWCLFHKPWHWVRSRIVVF